MEPTYPERSPSDGSDKLTRRGTTALDPLYLERAKLTIGDCRTELSDLRIAVKTARSYREKAVNILKQANDALSALEDIIYSPLANSTAMRSVHPLASRLHSTIDEAEALVKIYGQMSSVGKIFTKVTSATSTATKFDEAGAALQNIASEARSVLAHLASSSSSYSLLQEISLPVVAPRAGSGSKGTGHALSPSGGSSVSDIYHVHFHNQQLQRQSNGNINAPTTNATAAAPFAVAAVPTQGAILRSQSPGSTANIARHSSGTTATTTNLDNLVSGALEPASTAYSEQFSPSSPLTSMDLLGSVVATNALGQTSRSITEVLSTGIAKRQLRKGSRQDTLNAFAYIPPFDSDPFGSPGRTWTYIGRLFGGDRLLVNDISSSVETNVVWGRNEGAITAMYVDNRGYIWTGHRSGFVGLWDALKRTLYCSTKACTSVIKTITTDESGLAWVGTEKGHVRRVLLSRQITDDGSIVGHELTGVGTLKHTGTGNPEISSSADLVCSINADPTGMVVNKLAREKAHEGPVYSIAAAGGRVWTCGGSAAFVCLREWSQRGEFMQKCNLKSVGAASCMMLISPIVRITTSSERAPSAASTLAMASIPSYLGGGNSGSGGSTDVPQAWQLMTGHNNGIVQIWGQVSGVLKPLLRIGTQRSAVTGMAICEAVGVVCTVHQDGKMLVQAFPGPKDADAFTVPLLERSVGSIQSLVRGEVKVSDIGVCAADGGSAGIVTASIDGSTTFWPDGSLRSLCEEAGVNTLPPGTPIEKWPIIRYDATSCQRAMKAMSASAYGEEIQAPKPQGPPDGSSSDALRTLFPAAANRWLLEYRALELDAVVGEGAFGKVWRGRWQETDVAIKVFTSLAAFGLPTSSVVSGQDGAAAEGNHAFNKDVKDSVKTLGREVELMMDMRHPNIILFMGICTDPPCVVTEYCSRGSLYDLLIAAREDEVLARQLHWPRRLGLALDAAKGMLYLHSHKPPIIHRDLKSPNLLVDGYWRAKVTDFNLSRLSESVPSVASSVVANNPRWHAPEIIRQHDFTMAGDVYSFGLILWELLTWELPFEHLTPFQIILLVGEKGERPLIPERTSRGVKGGVFPGYDDYIALMQSCWAQDPADRPAFDQVIASLRSIGEKMTSTGIDTGPTPVAVPMVAPLRRISSVKYTSGQVDGGGPGRGVAAGPSGKFSSKMSQAVSNFSLNSTATAPFPSPFESSSMSSGLSTKNNSNTNANGNAPAPAPTASTATAAAGGGAYVSAPASPFDGPFSGAFPPPRAVAPALQGPFDAPVNNPSTSPKPPVPAYVKAPLSPFDEAAPLSPFDEAPMGVSPPATEGGPSDDADGDDDNGSVAAPAAATSTVAPAAVIDSVYEVPEGRLAGSGRASGSERSGLSQELSEQLSEKQRNTSLLRRFRDSLKLSNNDRKQG